jgi:hypothetical protein
MKTKEEVKEFFENLPPKYIKCPECGKLIEHSLLERYECKCGTIWQNEKKCPHCDEISVCDKYGFCELCGNNWLEEDFDERNPANVEAGKKGYKALWTKKDICGFIAEKHCFSKLSCDGYQVMRTMKFDRDIEKNKVVEYVFNERSITKGTMDDKIKSFHL